MKTLLKLIFSLVICYAAPLLSMFIGGEFRSEWYNGLNKPWFMPPGWLFGPVWTVLYSMMGVSLFLVWKLGWGRRGVRLAIMVFVAQLIVNASWTPVFFGLQMPGVGLVVIVVLWILIGLTIAVFWRCSKWAALLLVPYWGWVTFATVLNAAIAHLN
ncbi:MAG: tryptophan-rich sensory protein [Sedimentisphaerales bacterium]|nr:tryptophan-rich sensory protein [Sedimentisphaerales bacterium]